MSTIARWMALFRLRTASAALAVLVSLAVAAQAPAQAESDPAQLLDDFVHYALVAKPDLAAANAQALMDSGITDADLAKLLDEGRVTPEKFDRAVSRAQLVTELTDVVAELARRVEAGRLDLARDKDRIDEAIAMLIGNQRQKLLAARRLEAAGEYAVPSLLNRITEGRDEQLKAACQEMLRTIGRLAVTPLCEALPNLADPTGRRIICDLLGEIGYPHAGPFLYELSQDENAAIPVREAAVRAFNRVGGVEAPLSALFSNLARQYFNGTASLVAYPYESTNIVWRYDAFVGLEPTPVPTEIFGQVMAMKRAAAAARIDPANGEAISLFVAANLKRENDLPAGEDDPIFSDTRYTPAFYATVFGTDTCMDVLAMALDGMDTPLVRDALAALAYTTGGSNLFAGDRQRQPLLEALQYPDRRVQYEAAMTLGRALPQQRYGGDFAVVPLLASAVRTSNQTFGLVIADSEEDRRVIAGRLEQLGFSVLGAASSVSALEAVIAEAVGIDLVVIRHADADEARQSITDLRILPKTAAAPVLLVASGVDLPSLKQDYLTDPSVKASPWATEDAFEAAIDELLLHAAGGRMDEAEAEIYAIESLQVLRDIAVSGCPAYSIADAESALIDALQLRTGGTRMLVAKILALIDSDRAQRTLFDAAFAAEGGGQVELLNHVCDSVKRFGGRAEDRHLRALLALVAASADETAESAARLHGALNLSAAERIGLLPE
ncbi:MAG: hypothetical protein JSV91_00850 [Phycisphaerales bacterium]|nr:MAG: hypothetical protein JSV91_00850 [Phycisphaerales bacterium]